MGLLSGRTLLNLFSNGISLTTVLLIAHDYQDHLVCLHHMLTIITGHSHITKIIVGRFILLLHLSVEFFSCEQLKRSQRAKSRVKLAKEEFTSTCILSLHRSSADGAGGVAENQQWDWQHSHFGNWVIPKDMQGWKTERPAYPRLEAVFVEIMGGIAGKKLDLEYNG